MGQWHYIDPSVIPITLVSLSKEQMHAYVSYIPIVYMHDLYACMHYKSDQLRNRNKEQRCFKMKTAIALIALISLTGILVWAAPNQQQVQDIQEILGNAHDVTKHDEDEVDKEDAEMETFIQDLMSAHKQDGAQVEDFLHKLMNEEEETASEQKSNDDDDDDDVVDNQSSDLDEVQSDNDDELEAAVQELIQDDDRSNDDSDLDVAALQELIAKSQDPDVKAQFWGAIARLGTRLISRVGRRFGRKFRRTSNKFGRRSRRSRRRLSRSRRRPSTSRRRYGRRIVRRRYWPGQQINQC